MAIDLVKAKKLYERLRGDVRSAVAAERRGESRPLAQMYFGVYISPRITPELADKVSRRIQAAYKCEDETARLLASRFILDVKERSWLPESLKNMQRFQKKADELVKKARRGRY